MTMLWLWLVIMWVLPTCSCLLFVLISPAPDVLTAASAAIGGGVAALTALFIIH
jgi:hypothetical protein